MCEFCSKHGDGKIWYKNAANYSRDLVSDLKRRKYIENFLESTIDDGFNTLGRLEGIFRRKGRLPAAISNKMVSQAKTEHFGQVLPIEEISQVVLKAKTIVRMPCACRWVTEKKEVYCCYAISYGPDAWYNDLDMSYFGKPSNEGLEPVSPDEAIKQIKKTEEHGAIHSIWTMLTPFIGAVCNCTEKECLAMRTLSGINIDTMFRAEYFGFVDNKRCNACGSCLEECRFNAISSSSNKKTAKISADKCFGCGLCRNACENDAISLILRQ